VLFYPVSLLITFLPPADGAVARGDGGCCDKQVKVSLFVDI